MLDEKHMKFFRSFFRILCCKDGLLHCGNGSNGSTFWLPFLCARNRIHLLGGSSQLGSVVNNHGDRKSSKDQVVGPIPNGRT